MRNFNINPLDYTEYANDRLYDGERVYRFAFGTVDEAYAIRESGDGYDDFLGEVESTMRRKYGRKMAFIVEDVTGIFDEEE